MALPPSAHEDKAFISSLQIFVSLLLIFYKPQLKQIYHSTEPFVGTVLSNFVLRQEAFLQISQSLPRWNSAEVLQPWSCHNLHFIRGLCIIKLPIWLIFLEQRYFFLQTGRILEILKPKFNEVWNPITTHISSSQQSLQDGNFSEALALRLGAQRSDDGGNTFSFSCHILLQISDLVSYYTWDSGIYTDLMLDSPLHSQFPSTLAKSLFLFWNCRAARPAL